MADNPFQFSGPEAASDAAPPPIPGAAPLGGIPARQNAFSIQNLLGGNWPLAALFAVGIACLYGMSLMKGPAAASAEQMQVQSSVEDALAKLNVAPSVDADKNTATIVETFYAQAKSRQISPSLLRSNPFLFRAAVRPAPVPTPAPESATAAKPAEPEGQADALAAVKTLNLQSVIIRGESRVALISDNLLTEGQTIHGWTVKKIGPREVHLQWRDQDYILKMSE